MRILFVCSILLITTVLACNFSKGVKKDLLTGMSVAYNGFAIDDAFLTAGEDRVRMKSNKLPLGEEMAVVVTGVTNYSVQEGRVYPGCTIILTDTEGTQLLHLDDAFAQYTDGLPRDQGEVLTATITTGAPMMTGEKYRINVRFYDKMRPESEIIAQADLVME